MHTNFNEWIENNLETQKGKTIIVTGGNSGIGYYTALGLAKIGADVIIAGRDIKKMQDAIEAMNKEDLQGTISYGLIDLSSGDSVRSFVKDFNVKHPSLDVLINNAGVMMPPESYTKEGFELQFSVNFLGHFLLTDLLYNTLKTTTNSRVVTLSSIAHRGSIIDFSNLRGEKPYDAKREYYQSKLANLVFALELGKNIKSYNDNIISVACHPGFTKTGLQRHLNPEILKKITFMDTWQGSLPTLLAATNPNAVSGDYYGPDGEGEFSGFPALGIIDDAALDSKCGKKLWQLGKQYSNN